jgi:hypothetical protein
VEFLQKLHAPLRRNTLILQMAHFHRTIASHRGQLFELMDLYNDQKKQDAAPKLYDDMKR